jgi:hypothetical protein
MTESKQQSDHLRDYKIRSALLQAEDWLKRKNFPLFPEVTFKRLLETLENADLTGLDINRERINKAIRELKQYLIFTRENLDTELRKEIYRYLMRCGPCRRITLCELTEKSRTTVYDNLRKLQNRHVVTKFERHNNKRGRPKVYWCLPGDEDRPLQVEYRDGSLVHKLDRNQARKAKRILYEEGRHLNKGGGLNL